MSIKVVNVKTRKSDFYCARPSFYKENYGVSLFNLSNPVKHDKSVEGSREWVINQFNELFLNVLIHDKNVLESLNKILDYHNKHNEVLLGCFCKPKNCHVDIIAEYLNNVIMERNEEIW